MFQGASYPGFEMTLASEWDDLLDDGGAVFVLYGPLYSEDKLPYE